jgi:hypothetical protein
MAISYVVFYHMGERGGGGGGGGGGIPLRAKLKRPPSLSWLSHLLIGCEKSIFGGG